MANLNVVAHGINPETGDYLSPEERKALFKGKKLTSVIKPQSFKSGVSSGTFGGGGGISAIVKRQPIEKEPSEIVPIQENKTEDDGKARTVAENIRSTFYEFLKAKKERRELTGRFFAGLKPKRRTQKQVSDKMPLGMGRKIRGVASKASFGLFDMLGSLLKFAILDWISKPENKKIVETFVTVFKEVIKFLDWFITGVIDNILSGFAELVGGDSLLERIGGFFKLTFGLIGLRWLLNPFKIVKDLKFVFKNIGNFAKFFKNLFKLNAKGMGQALNGILKASGSIFRATLGRTLKRVLTKVFGKAFAKGATAFLKGAVKGIVKLVTKVPIVGPLIGFGVNLMMGEPVGRAAFKTVGATLLGGLGALIGSVVPVVGTMVGGVIGGLGGDWAGGVLYDALFGGKDEEKKEDDKPELSGGGIASGPKSGYLAMLHGTEVVIPIDKIPSILGAPFQALGSAIMGAMFAVIDSMGPVSSYVRGVAIKFLAPIMRAYGIEKFTKVTNVGKTEGSAETTAKKITKLREENNLESIFDIEMLKTIGSTIFTTGGLIINSLMGGPAQAKESDPISSFSSRGDGKDSSVTGGDFSGKKTPKNTSSAAGQWKPLLEMIAAYESVGGSYDSIYPGSTKPGLSQMTIAEADAWQASTASQRGSAAAGRYQFMNIKKQAAAAGIGPDELFSPENQDKMAIDLIEGKRGVTLDMIKNNPDEAMIRLGMEWAALPMPKNMQGHRGMVSAGQSYYAGDGKNAAHVSVDTVRSVFAAMGSAPVETAQQPTSPTPPALSQEQKSDMFKKAGMTALSADILSSPQSMQTTPEANFSPASSSMSAGSAMIPMSTEFSVQKKLRSTSTTGGVNILNISPTTNNMVSYTSTPLNSTSISESVVPNRI